MEDHTTTQPPSAPCYGPDCTHPSHQPSRARTIWAPVDEAAAHLQQFDLNEIETRWLLHFLCGAAPHAVITGIHQVLAERTPDGRS